MSLKFSDFLTILIIHRLRVLCIVWCQQMQRRTLYLQALKANLIGPETHAAEAREVNICIWNNLHVMDIGSKNYTSGPQAYIPWEVFKHTFFGKFLQTLTMGLHEPQCLEVWWHLSKKPDQTGETNVMNEVLECLLSAIISVGMPHYPLPPHTCNLIQSNAIPIGPII